MTQAADAFRPEIPSTARMYDYYLGGKDNYPADRAAAERAIASMPNGVVRTAAVQNRKFLMRAVRHLAAHHEQRAPGRPVVRAGKPRRLRRPRPDRARPRPRPAERHRARPGH